VIFDVFISFKLLKTKIIDAGALAINCLYSGGARPKIERTISVPRTTTGLAARQASGPFLYYIDK
jgi:hypothetical protein